MKTLKQWIVMSVAVCLVACGSSSNKSSSSIIEDTNTDGSDLVFEKANRSMVVKVEALNDESLCYLLREYNIEEGKNTLTLGDWSYTLTCDSSNREELFTYKPQGGDVIKDFIVTENDEIYLVELVRSPVEYTPSIPQYFIELKKLSMEGEVVRASIIEDIMDEQEGYFYSFLDGEGQFERSKLSEQADYEGKPAVLAVANIELTYKDGQLYVMASTYGRKLYQFDDQLNQIRNFLIMPSNEYMNFYNEYVHALSKVAVNDDGIIIVSYNLDRARERYFEDAFSVELPDQPVNHTNQLIQIINGSGEREVFVVGSEVDGERVVSTNIYNNELWIVANIERAKANAAGGTQEWDVAILSVNLESRTISNYFILHQDQEDNALSATMTESGQFIIAGENGYAQADTSSIVSYSKGFIWVVDINGELVQSEQVTGSKSVKVYHASEKNGVVTYGYTYNNEITHANCNREGSTCDQHAKIESFAVN